MTDAVTDFFAAWSETDGEARLKVIGQCMSAEFSYSDPRSGGRLTAIEALSDYVGMFTASAPGWTATVETSDTVNGYIRALVRFAGQGPDGQEIAQHGTYFAETDPSGKLKTLAGFVGTGAPA